MKGVKGKSSDFRLSQTLAYGVVKKGSLRRLHFMRPFAPCFGRLVAGAQVYLLSQRDHPALLFNTAYKHASVASIPEMHFALNRQITDEGVC
jgi:hypothetical protein